MTSTRKMSYFKQRDQALGAICHQRETTGLTIGW
eukprot:CAMPEP_0183344224 /NCGR_PEP_ID=MMETSP0164_2-20130417/9958_1 /TAXON_ID=221442 /ORGANISM="Coccolithus pelagicus ssp braarudi, Strain PLY182g" /LENGTH=33 /DNA_ID= /DNA_START= /DNA_END= /DNA_ORIENTATION=